MRSSKNQTKITIKKPKEAVKEEELLKSLPKKSRTVYGTRR